MLILQNLGGVKKSAFPDADHDLSHHRIRWGPVVLMSVPSFRLFVSIGLLHTRVILVFISASLSVMLLFVFALCESFSFPSCSEMCWLPLFIPAPVALVSLQLADLQLTWTFASVEACWSVKERGHRRAIWVSCASTETDCQCFQLVRVCVGTAATYALQWGFVEERLCNDKGYSSLLSWPHCSRAIHSWAFHLSEKSGSAYKTEDILWV